MTIILSLNNGEIKEMPLAEWIEIGKLKGYCKANKIRLNQITGIEYKPNQK